MDKTTLVTNAILDKFGGGINIYSADDILKAAGISEEQALEIYEQLKRNVSNIKS